VIALKEKATRRDPALGVALELDLPHRRLLLRGRDRLSHALCARAARERQPCGARSWRSFRPEFRCLTLELPLGSHTLPMPEDADLTPHGLAYMIAEALDALALEERRWSATTPAAPCARSW
jgi:hypothetical protein